MTAKIVTTRDNEDQALGLALAALARGEPVALPTETVYGLAADATNPDAVTAIYEAKGRPRFNPLIAHMADLDMAERHARFNETARRLASAFWPGALTLVLPASPFTAIHPLVMAGLDTVAVRVPTGFAARLIAAFGKPLAAPSANVSGRISATSAAHVAADLGDRIGLILDGGPTQIGLESTIVAVDGEEVTLLRPGGVAVEDIERVIGRKVERPQADGRIVAPGMLASHYAPEAGMALNARDCQEGDAVLRFGGTALAGDASARLVLDLSPSGDLREAAANLFAYMKRLDATGAAMIRVAPIPDTGLGEAINDRLLRAAAPRG